MKIIHCADIHLDSKLAALSHNKAILRRQEILNTFCNLIFEADKNGDGAVIVAGDLFESKFASPSTKSALINTFTAHQNVKIFILTGNHDESAFDDGFIKRLPPNVKLFSEGINRFDIDGVSFVGADLTTVSREQLKDIKWTPENYNILICHGDIGKNSFYGAIDLDMFFDKPIDYFALGHIHSYKKEGAGRGYAVYSGCLEPRGYDETGPKGFVWIDTSILDRSKSIRFVPYATRQVYSIRLDISDCASAADVIKKAASFIDGQSVTSLDLAEFYLTGEINEDCVFTTDQISQSLKPLLFDVKVKDLTKVKIDIEKIKNEISLKSQFVKTAEAKIKDAELLNRVLRYGLNALNGEEIDSL